MVEDDHGELVRRLYEAFNNRDREEIVAVCSAEMAFYPYVTTEAVGRDAPYVGVEGLNQYMVDIQQVWEELQISPSIVERRGDTLLVRGRVYARSRQLGIRDIPAAWLWGLRDGMVIRGEVFADPEDAIERFGELRG
jgi:ketosteroid isomerase-like protein